MYSFIYLFFNLFKIGEHRYENMQGALLHHNILIIYGKDPNFELTGFYICMCLGSSAANYYFKYCPYLE